MLTDELLFYQSTPLYSNKNHFFKAFLLSKKEKKMRYILTARGVLHIYKLCSLHKVLQVKNFSEAHIIVAFGEMLGSRVFYIHICETNWQKEKRTESAKVF